jgi:hypothetical protein
MVMILVKNDCSNEDEMIPIELSSLEAEQFKFEHVIG